jgi:hypothetical protein
MHESSPPEHEANPELEPAPEPRVEHEPLEKILRRRWPLRA